MKYYYNEFYERAYNESANSKAVQVNQVSPTGLIELKLSGNNSFINASSIAKSNETAMTIGVYYLS